jgi:hypothetical protein
MTIIGEQLNGAYILRDTDPSHRWYDAYGPNVAKCVEEFVNTPFSAADQMAGWLNTILEAGAGDSTAALVAGSATGELLFTNAAGDNDGANVQLLGEAFYFASRYPTYFGCKFQISDATQEDAFAGLCITNATLEAGMTDGLYFRKTDGDTRLYLVAEKDSNETLLACCTMVAATNVIAEYTYLDGVLTAYINGVPVGTIYDSDINFPDDEYLTPSLAAKNGEAVVKTMNVDWIRVIQVQSV